MQMTLEEVYADLKKLCKLAKREDNLIIMGDWNAIVGEGAVDQEVDAFELGTRNERGDRLVDFCKQHDMTIHNTFQNIHCRKRYTWKMPGDIKRYWGRGSGIKYIDAKHIQALTLYILHQQKIKIKPLPSDTTEDKWNKIKDAIHDAASNTLKRNSPEPRKPWINDNIIRDIEERRKYKNDKDNHGIRRYKEFKNKINIEATFAREKWLEGKKTKLKSRIRVVDGNLILDNDKIATRWKQYLDAPGIPERRSLNNNNNPDILGEVILRDEFNKTLNLMKTGKAADIDDIAIELIQNACTRRAIQISE
ncbi:Endonuclease/exonuclease/phosphatase [Cinara cedri]|uniref:Endonuclease/exonuclease/phosphatase n=1 Tax=Cinara cedri TaxID=506608 RepID=A0A5E4M467_9HEMI|nr:Endonuclease/exonuclease/phosphatase [Cinara cedri]